MESPHEQRNLSSTILLMKFTFITWFAMLTIKLQKPLSTLINVLKLCHWIYAICTGHWWEWRSYTSHVTELPAGKFPCLFTGYCPLSLSRYLLSTTVSWKKKSRERERERVCVCMHTRVTCSQYKFEPVSKRAKGTSGIIHPGKMVCDIGTWRIHMFIIWSFPAKKSNQKPANWIIHEPI